MTLQAPFPWFGGKRDIADAVWSRFGCVKQYIEPFCGSAAVLLSSPAPAPLEVVNDLNGFIANFWRAVKHQPAEVARAADYPVSHIDLGARHVWLMSQRARIGEELHDVDWPGDARAAGWWLWGQCCWIGSGWCEWQDPARGQCGEGHVNGRGQIPHVGNTWKGVQARGKVPHVSDTGKGVQARGKVPHVSDSGMGVITSAGQTAWKWMHGLAGRLERVRIVHGDWHRCLNNHYGGESTAIFMDPPYRAYEAMYGHGTESVAEAVASWANENGNLRIALCGHIGDYTLPGWECEPWKRKRLTYSGGDTTGNEAIWFSPACLSKRQRDLFAELDAPRAVGDS